jgi:hypothetical protein
MEMYFRGQDTWQQQQQHWSPFLKRSDRRPEGEEASVEDAEDDKEESDLEMMREDLKPFRGLLQRLEQRLVPPPDDLLALSGVQKFLEDDSFDDMSTLRQYAAGVTSPRWSSAHERAPSSTSLLSGAEAEVAEAGSSEEGLHVRAFWDLQSRLPSCLQQVLLYPCDFHAWAELQLRSETIITNSRNGASKASEHIQPHTCAPRSSFTCLRPPPRTFKALEEVHKQMQVLLEERQCQLRKHRSSSTLRHSAYCTLYSFLIQSRSFTDQVDSFDEDMMSAFSECSSFSNAYK